MEQNKELILHKISELEQLLEDDKDNELMQLAIQAKIEELRGLIN